MNRLTYLCLTLALGYGCKHSKNDSQLREQFGSDALDALILSSDLVETSKDCRIEGLNLILDALNEGLLRNGALTGLGTDYPVGKKLKTDSLYFQGLRIASIWDWELGQRLANREPQCLPASAGVQLSTFPLGYQTSLAKPFSDQVAKIKKTAAKINPSLGLFDVLRLDFRELIQAWPPSSAYPPAHLTALFQGVQRKLRYAQDASRQTTDDLTKLKGLMSSFSPLAISFQSQFDPNHSRYYLEAELPPLAEIEDGNVDDLKLWKLRYGLKKRAFSRPIQISVATLTHLAYLPEEDPSRQAMIKVQLFKDFKQADLIKARIIFGRLTDPNQDQGILPIDYKNYRDSLSLSLYPNVELKPNDSSIIRNLKTQFNDIAGQIKVEARIHQLTLNLQRRPLPTPSDVRHLLLAPQFSLKDSDISFRLHRFTADETERKGLSNVGFICQDQPASAERDCFQDFGAYTELRNFVLQGDQGVANGRLTTKLGNAFKGLLNSVIRYNVKFIIDWNVQDIEAAVDQEFAAIFEELIDQQLKTRDKIRQRLEERLFHSP